MPVERLAGILHQISDRNACPCVYEGVVVMIFGVERYWEGGEWTRRKARHRKTVIFRLFCECPKMCVKNDFLPFLSPLDILMSDRRC